MQEVDLLHFLACDDRQEQSVEGTYLRGTLGGVWYLHSCPLLSPFLPGFSSFGVFLLSVLFYIFLFPRLLCILVPGREPSRSLQATRRDQPSIQPFSQPPLLLLLLHLL